ncbi:phosphatase PAP2 family protein [Paenibacillus sp. SZ31]|uniref:S-layer homology domain-containing protein n=1 Tax=Paenibacillus sp. SZ31 TaxID=2725555 RepID=UPI00146D89B9|nr:S-layer homology domain-containing protein [Paenibacillus sp. SZ31]NMI05157.1 phosphatase PAP2 family protein [Paenibacillus sp. SZ31]
MRKPLKKSLALLLMLSMVGPTFAEKSFAADQKIQFSDIKGHWAEANIQAWGDEGLIRGYLDRSFKPNTYITRAEFMNLVNGAFGYSGQAKITFNDVSESAWYYEAISIANANGYIDGYTDGTMKPQDPITRQEAAKVIAGILNLELNETAANVFSDSSSIAAWSKGAVGGAAAAKIIAGYTDGSFKPLNSITRAEAVSALVKAVETDATTAAKPAKPKGTATVLSVNPPAAEARLSAVEHGGNAADGTLKNIAETNPFIDILDGFDQVWSLNQADWRDGTAATKLGADGKNAKYGDGPTLYYDGFKNDPTVAVADQKTFANAEIRNKAAWEANIKYVEDATKNRTAEETLAAYYDDQRDKIYSMMEAFGPLANTYVDVIKPKTSVERSVDEMNVLLTEETVEDESQGIGSDWADTELADMVALVDLVRFKIPASSNPAKYFYSTPRPWRMNSNGEVKEVVDSKGLPVWQTIGEGEATEVPLASGGKKSTGEKHYQQYETNVVLIPALSYVKRIAEDGRGKDGGFPSGHTSASYLSVLPFAYATPERFSEFLTRAAQMGENRIVTGMHSPLDVVGARIQATAMTAYAFNQAENKDLLEKAYENAGEVFGAEAKEKNMSLYEYAHTVTEEYTFKSAYDENKWEDHDANKAFYREKMTSGLPQTGTKGLAPVVPQGAEALLETRQPYLTDEQRREVLYTTSIDSGYPVLDESKGWGRLDLVSAADGYGAFLNNVTVDMDASKGRFNAEDWWRNDITGSGMLTKKGTGTLTLTGKNSYTGGTLLQAGTLVAESATAFGTGDLYVENGTVVVNVDGALNLNKNFTMDNGTLELVVADGNSQLNVGRKLYIDGGILKLDLSNYKIEGSKDITLITANGITGEFDSVTADGYDVTVTYENGRVIAHVVAK